MRNCFLLFFCVLCLNAMAHGPQRQKMTHEEFQTKQKEYIARHAELTETESAAFFPLYFELQGKKLEANRRVWKQARTVPSSERTEDEYDKIVDALADVKIQCATLEKEYLQKFKEILPAKKLLRVQIAEERFQRELLRGMQQGNKKFAKSE